jgi:hypothetical protein
MTPSHQIIEINMRANAWERIRNELKINLKFYVSSRDVRIVCSRLNMIINMAAKCTCDVLTTQASYRRGYQEWATSVRVTFYGLNNVVCIGSRYIWCISVQTNV